MLNKNNDIAELIILDERTSKLLDDREFTKKIDDFNSLGIETPNLSMKLSEFKDYVQDSKEFNELVNKANASASYAELSCKIFTLGRLLEEKKDVLSAQFSKDYIKKMNSLTHAGNLLVNDCIFKEFLVLSERYKEVTNMGIKCKELEFKEDYLESSKRIIEEYLSEFPNIKKQTFSKAKSLKDILSPNGDLVSIYVLHLMSKIEPIDDFIKTFERYRSELDKPSSVIESIALYRNICSMEQCFNNTILGLNNYDSYQIVKKKARDKISIAMGGKRYKGDIGAVIGITVNLIGIRDKIEKIFESKFTGQCDYFNRLDELRGYKKYLPTNAPNKQIACPEIANYLNGLKKEATDYLNIRLNEHKSEISQRLANLKKEYPNIPQKEVFKQEGLIEFYSKAAIEVQKILEE